MKIFPETSPGSRAGRELEINKNFVQIFTETRPGLAEPAGSSKSISYVLFLQNRVFSWPDIKSISLGPGLGFLWCVFSRHFHILLFAVSFAFNMSVFSYTSPYLIVFYDSISLWHFFFCRTLPLLESLFSESSGSSLPCARPNNWLCGSTWVLKARIHARSSRRFRDIFHCLQVFSIRVGVCRFLH